jgi:uncharacterized membrane protein
MCMHYRLTLNLEGNNLGYMLGHKSLLFTTLNGYCSYVWTKCSTVGSSSVYMHSAYVYCLHNKPMDMGKSIILPSITSTLLFQKKYFKIHLLYKYLLPEQLYQIHFLSKCLGDCPVFPYV